MKYRLMACCTLCVALMSANAIAEEKKSIGVYLPSNIPQCVATPTRKCSIVQSVKHSGRTMIYLEATRYFLSASTRIYTVSGEDGAFIDLRKGKKIAYEWTKLTDGKRLLTHVWLLPDSVVFQGS